MRSRMEMRGPPIGSLMLRIETSCESIVTLRRLTGAGQLRFGGKLHAVPPSLLGPIERLVGTP